MKLLLGGIANGYALTVVAVTAARLDVDRQIGIWKPVEYLLFDVVADLVGLLDVEILRKDEMEVDE